MIDLFIVGFRRPDLLREQLRLINKHLTDPFQLHLVDNTPDHAATEMKAVCDEHGASYQSVHSDRREHNDALNFAARAMRELSGSHVGFLDHDIFPMSSTTIIEKVEPAGFLGLGQTYSPRVGEAVKYLWPGWCFFSREWIGERQLNFDGIRGKYHWDDGDCGSMMHSLFTDEDWAKHHRVNHNYGTIREEDGHGLQSYGYELIDTWLHFTNASHWKDVPQTAERDRLLKELLA